MSTQEDQEGKTLPQVGCQKSSSPSSLSMTLTNAGTITQSWHFCRKAWALSLAASFPFRTIAAKLYISAIPYMLMQLLGYTVLAECQTTKSYNHASAQIEQPFSIEWGKSESRLWGQRQSSPARRLIYWKVNVYLCTLKRAWKIAVPIKCI